MNNEKNNKGFSMIELIVTIAIMALVTGISVSIYSWIKTNQIESVANKINSALSSVRSDTLTKAETYEMSIEGTSDDVVIIIRKLDGVTEIGRETIKLGKAATIYCIGTDSNKYKITTGGAYKLYIGFNRADGSFSRIQFTSFTAGTSVIPITNDIHIEYAGLYRRISLKKETGKHCVLKH